MQILSGKEANKKGSKQQATSSRQASHEGRRDERANGRKEEGSKQHATSNKQGRHEKEIFCP
jgi:hypothetical protein